MTGADVRPRPSLARGWPDPPLERLSLARGGDEAAFLDAAAAVEKPLWALCWRLAGTPEAGAALGHDVLLAARDAFRRGAGPATRESLGEWLATLAVCSVWSAVSSRVPPIEHGTGVPLPPAAGPEAAEQRERLSIALARLSPRARALVVLRDLDGLALADLASVLGETADRIEEMLAAARLSLASDLVRLAGGSLRRFPPGICDDCRNAIGRSLAVNLSAAEAAHVETCVECRLVRDALLRALSGFAGSVDVAPSPYFRSWLTDRVEAERTGLIARAAVAFRHPRRAVAVGAGGAVLMLAAIFGLRGFSSVQGEHPPARAARRAAPVVEPVFHLPSPSPIPTVQATLPAFLPPSPAPTRTARRRRGSRAATPKSSARAAPIESPALAAPRIDVTTSALPFLVRRIGDDGSSLEVAEPKPLPGGGATVAIRFSVPGPQTVELSIFDSQTNRVAQLLNWKRTAGGEIVWRVSQDDLARSGETFLVRLITRGHSLVVPVNLAAPLKQGDSP